MPRGRRSPDVSLEINPDVVPAVNPDETGGEGVASLFDFQGEARVRVLHRNEKTQRYEPHGYFPTDATEESVLQEFGGGRFRVQLLVRDDTGREVIKTTRDFDLPGEYKPPAGDLPGIGSRRAGAPRVENGNGHAVAMPTMQGVPSSGDLMQVLNAGVVSTLLDLLKTTKEVNQRPAPTMDPMILKMMESQTAMQAQMMQFMLTLATKDNGDSKKEVLSMMAQMKEMLSPSGATTPVPTNPMEMFKSMLETFKSFREAAEDVAPQQAVPGDPLLSSIPKLVEVIGEQHAMNKLATAQGGVRHVPTPTATGGVAMMPSIAPPSPQPEMPIWRLVLKQQATRLVNAATNRESPEVMAAMAIMFAPANFIPTLREFFHKDSVEEVTEAIIAEIPELSVHRPWVNEFVENVQMRLFPEEFSDDEPTTQEIPPPSSTGESES